MSERHSRTISSETSNRGRRRHQRRNYVVRNSKRRRARRWDDELPLLNTERDVPCTPGQTWEITPVIPSQVRSPTPTNSCGRYVRIPQNDGAVQSPSASNETRTYHVSETDDQIDQTNTRKRKLELEAAEAVACIKKRALIAQRKIELDLLNKQLSLELATNAVTDVCIESPQESNPRTVDLFERSITEQQPTTSCDKNDDENKNAHRRVANRLAEDKSLPVFNGNPIEWLRFKNIYDLTTKIGRYNDSENLVRLYNSLVGEARDAVDALMVTACTAEQIIETLRLRFGNPENVLRKFVEDVKSTPKVNSGPGFTLLATKVGNAVAAMQSLNHQGYLHSSELIEEILAKLSEPMLIHYIHYASSNDTREPRLVILSKFLLKESDAAYVAGASMFNAKIPSTHKSSKYGSNSKHIFSITERRQQESGPCLYCKGENHHIYDCKDFASLPINNRWDCIKTKGVCFRCLNPGHNRWKCRAPYCPVNGCGRPHHALLHNDGESSGGNNRRVMPSRDRVGNQSNNPVIATVTQAPDRNRVLLKILPVTLIGLNGRIKTYALLDDGSTATLLDADMAKKIGVTGPSMRLSLQGIAGAKTSENHSEIVDLKILGCELQQEWNLSKVLTVKGLCLPRQSIHSDDVMRYKHLKNACIPIYNSAQPTILIGQDHWDLLTPVETLIGKRNQPAASRTLLGWVLHGNNPDNQSDGHNSVSLCIECAERDDPTNMNTLHELVKASYNLDNIGIKGVDRVKSLDKRAEQIFRETVRQTTHGWEVGLLWRYGNPKLPENKIGAMKRLQSLEKRMDNDPCFAKLYGAEMSKMFEAGYAEKVTQSSAANPTWYLPHFAVTKQSNPNKLRIVFDAAAKFRGVSLNDCLLTGPDMINSLSGCLMRFRQYPYAVKADIKEMFLRVYMRPDDRDSQRFLWRGMRRDSDPEVFRVTRLTFGERSAPSSAIYVLNENAKVFKDAKPKAVAAIKRKFYVDDYLDSFKTVEEAILVTNDIRHINEQGGFHMHDWNSNEPQILKQLGERVEIDSIPLLKCQDIPYQAKTLGLNWNPKTDMLSFEIKQSTKTRIHDVSPLTKRQILSAVMSIFDPLGFITPFTVRGRILLQQLWKSKIGWDTEVKDSDKRAWETWITDLSKLEKCEVPRSYIVPNRDPVETSLHTFCDASSEACAAVTYFRFKFPDDSIDVKFVSSKSRVASLTPQTIPRLELQAALIGSRLAQMVQTEHEYQISERTFWTDSRTVLIWIRSDPTEYNAFVSHRLAEIDELTNPLEWKWTPSNINPADQSTKTVNTNWSAEGNWFSGPAFLRLPKSQWPKQPQLSKDCMEDAARSESKVVLTCRFEHVFNLQDTLPDIQRFSRFLRLIRASARVLLCVDLLLKRADSNTLTVDLINRATKNWIIKSQSEDFYNEIKSVRNEESISKSSKLLKLTPYLDDDGVLRARGRINAAPSIPYDTKYPIILNGENPFTRLLVYDYHTKMNHAGEEMVLNELRQRYWIVRMRPTVRSVVYKCQSCRNRLAKPRPPIMGDLPHSRLAHHERPFTHCGVDYFGPMSVKVGRRLEKRWCVLFTCMCTRAIHLELSSSLSSDSAIMALQRMASRRGYPRVMYSDNGTNLRGANQELKTAIKALDLEKQRDFAVNKGMDWVFIPPNAPHMGGAWERLIGCVKATLKKILNGTSVKEETLATLLAEAEHTVNSRPLTHISIDHRDEEAITPNHFLIGSSSGCPIPGKFGSVDLLSRKQWRLAQTLANRFWQRWVREYLPSLVPRTKWTLENPPYEKDDIVTIVDPNFPRNTWLKGVIEKVYPGKDSRTRVVDVRTSRGVYTRPVTKLIKLSTHNEL